MAAIRAISIIMLIIFTGLTVFSIGGPGIAAGANTVTGEVYSDVYDETGIIAVVNGEKITQDQLDKRMQKVKLSLEQQGANFDNEKGHQMLRDLEKQVLEEMIVQALILQTARQKGLYPSEQAVSVQMEEIEKRFGGREQFEQALQTYGYTRQELKEKLVYDLAFEALYKKITGDVRINDQDAKKWYDKNKNLYKIPAKIKARSIFIKFETPAKGKMVKKGSRTEAQAKKIALNIIKQLKKGVDFAKLARSKSEDRFRNDGGLIKDASGVSPYPKGTVMPPEFDRAAVKLKAGKYTKTPVKAAGGFYIIKLEALIPEKQLAYKEVRVKILEELTGRRTQEKFNQFIDDLRKKAVIEEKTS